MRPTTVNKILLGGALVVLMATSAGCYAYSAYEDRGYEDRYVGSARYDRDYDRDYGRYRRDYDRRYAGDYRQYDRRFDRDYRPYGRYDDRYARYDDRYRRHDNRYDRSGRDWRRYDRYAWSDHRDRYDEYDD
jgi:hypothetical protein